MSTESDFKPRFRFRMSFGMSFGDTVPLWGKGKYHRRFYAFANLPCDHSYGSAGFKAWCVFVRVMYGRTAA